ncbi:MAG: MG2 domain-containing protein [Oligosphaeraceae bacterium]
MPSFCQKFAILLVCLGIFCRLGLLPVLSQEEDASAVKFPTARPLHYLSTDKEIYHPGETVYIRDVVLDGMTNYPLEEFMGQTDRFQWKILGPRDVEMGSGRMAYTASVGGVTWAVPASAPGGVYRLRVEDQEKEGAPAERVFEVRHYRAPRLRSQIEFTRRGYLPGETVVAVLSCRRAAGDSLENPRISATAQVEGKVVFQQEELPWKDGCAQVSFPLPEGLQEGDGTLTFLIEDGGVRETAAKTIPVLLEREEVFFYPEGGELVWGALNRVYVEARSRDGKEADIRGVLKDDQGAVVAEYHSLFGGRGILEFTPRKGRRYALEVPSSRGATPRSLPLPEAVAGSLLRATAQAYAFDEPLAVEVKSSPDTPRKPGYLTLRKREKELSRVELEGKTEGRWILPAAEEEGVLVATLYGQDGTPLAERLLFRRPRFQIHLAFQGLEEARTPGEKVTLKVRSTDAQGNPVSAHVGLCVSDASVAQMRERREWAPRLPVMVYLENEVLSLADAEEYLPLEDATARERLDLLLGTQGWRRFVLQRQEELRKSWPDALQRILAPLVELRPVPVLFKGRMLAMNAMAGGAMEDEDGLDFAAVPLMMVEDGAVMPEEEEEEPAREMEAVILPAPPMAAKRIAAPFRPPRRGQWVREYAHQARKERRPGDRVDFTETIYWAANVTTDPRTGEAEFSFEMPDTLGAFRVTGDAFGANGALGAATGELTCVQPFYGEVKLPLFLSAGDRALLPVTLVNATQETLDGVNLVVETGEVLRLLDKVPSQGALAPGERRGLLVAVEALKPGDARVVVRAMAGGHQDQVTRSLPVVSPLFPLEFSTGARISRENPLKFRLPVPEEVENGTQRVTAQVYTSPAATMEAALNALLRQPHGCFEQTSSTNYPLVMAQQYFLSHAPGNPETVARARELLEEGYGKLVSFQCASKGYEWFGADPGHEALTAYGLMEFADMAKVMPVDENMMADTRRWLLNRRDGEGGFQQNEKALDSFGRAPRDTTNAYIVWALLESGESPESLEKEIRQVVERANAGEDDYLKALAANILCLAKRPAEAKAFADILARHQKADGTMAEEGPTITCSMNRSRTLECVSLAALAWIRCGQEYVAPVERAMKFLAESCKEGKFGTTQSTVLVLKAINAYDATFARPKSDGAVQLWLDGRPMGEPVPFTKESQGILALPDCGLGLTPGEHELEIRLQGESELNASLLVEAKTPLVRSLGPLSLATTLDRPEAVEGEPMELRVSLKNGSQEELSMPVAIVPIPGGLEPRQEQLKELVGAGRIAAFEIQGQEVVLYWRGIHAGEELQVPLALTATLPGEYTGAASRAYPYYDDGQKAYQPGVKVTVTPRKP